MAPSATTRTLTSSPVEGVAGERRAASEHLVVGVGDDRDDAHARSFAGTVLALEQPQHGDRPLRTRPAIGVPPLRRGAEDGPTGLTDRHNVGATDTVRIRPTSGQESQGAWGMELSEAFVRVIGRHIVMIAVLVS